MAAPLYDDEPDDGVECILCGNVEDPRSMQFGVESNMLRERPSE